MDHLNRLHIDLNKNKTFIYMFKPYINMVNTKQARFVGKIFQIHESLGVIIKKDALELSGLQNEIVKGSKVVVTIEPYEMREQNDKTTESKSTKNEQPKQKKERKILVTKKGEK